MKRNQTRRGFLRSRAWRDLLQLLELLVALCLTFIFAYLWFAWIEVLIGKV